MTDYLLVHGAWQGAWGWERVVQLLQERGHRAVALDLPGHGSRAHEDLSKIRLQNYVEAVIAEIEGKNMKDVVLVGHSLAGITLPYVALRLPERIKRLVFISCMVPDEGKRVVDMLSPVDRLLYRLIVGLGGARQRGAKLPRFIARWKFCNDMDRATANQVLNGMTPEPVGPWEEPISRRGLENLKIGMTYVLLTRDRAIPPERQRRMAHNLGEPELVELEAGHNAPISRPRELVEVLLRYA